MGDEENYEVEAILGEKNDPSTGELVYEIKWKGYPSEENTWELREDLLLDGHDKAVKEYERERDAKKKDDPKKTKKSASRSRTPVKRVVPAKVITTPLPKPQFEETSTTQSDNALASDAVAFPRLLRFLIVSFVLTISIAVALDAESIQDPLVRIGAKLNPGVVSFLAVLRYGSPRSVTTSGTARVALWFFFWELLSVGVFTPVPVLQKIAELAWHLEAANVVGRNINYITVTIVAFVAWYVASNSLTHFSFHDVITFTGFWTAIAGIDKWAENQTVLNFLEAVASGVLLVSCYAPEPAWTWSTLGLLTLVSMMRV